MVTIYPSTPHNIQEDLNPHQHHCENVGYRKVIECRHERYGSWIFQWSHVYNLEILPSDIDLAAFKRCHYFLRCYILRYVSQGYGCTYTNLLGVTNVISR
jgi:hypothetical protein